MLILKIRPPSISDVTHLGGGESAKRWHYSISLYSKMGDKEQGGVKNLKKWVTSFMDGPFLDFSKRSILFWFFFQFVEFTDFVELVWKRCQLYVRMRSQPCYSLACHALRNLINQASTYNKFTTERIKTMCLFFKVNYVGWRPQSFMYFFDGRSLSQDIMPQCFFIQQVL